MLTISKALHRLMSIMHHLNAMLIQPSYFLSESNQLDHGKIGMLSASDPSPWRTSAGHAAIEHPRRKKADMSSSTWASLKAREDDHARHQRLEHFTG
jgi:hypothetical protein